jgi:hypothetical protein
VSFRETAAILPASPAAMPAHSPPRTTPSRVMLWLSASIAAVFIVGFVTPYLTLDPTQYGMF